MIPLRLLRRHNGPSRSPRQLAISVSRFRRITSLARAHRMIGDYDRAIYHFKKNVDVASRRSDLRSLRLSVSCFGRVALSIGIAPCRTVASLPKQPFTGTKRFALRRLANHPFSLSTAYFAVGYLHLRKGAIDKAIALLEHSLEICRIWNIRQNLPRVAAALGYAFAAAGRVGEALPLLDLANERARHPATRVQLAQGYLLIGKLEEATSLANQALDSVPAPWGTRPRSVGTLRSR